MTNKEALEILTKTDRVGVNLIFGNDEETTKYNQDSLEALALAIKALEERPTGEWIDHSADEGYVECPICRHLTNCNGNIDELHYCWNCGADMRVKGELNMIDLFGIKAKQDCLSHLRKITELEDQIQEQKRLIELQAQKIEGLKNQTPWFGSDIDYPNSRR